MAEMLLRHRLAPFASEVDVASAGLLPGGRPASGGAIEVMTELGFDLRNHVSQQVNRSLLGASDLILTMTRAQVRELAVLDGATLPKSFTLKHFVREVPAGWDGAQPVAEWLASVEPGRDRRTLLGDDAVDDVVDPMGKPQRVYRAVAAELTAAVDKLVPLLGLGDPPGGWNGSPT